MTDFFWLDPHAHALLQLVFERPYWREDDLLAAARDSGIDSIAARQCLQNLIDHGLLSADGQDRLRVVDPRVALAPDLTRYQQQLAEQSRQVDQAQALLSSLEQEYALARLGVADWESERLADVEAVRTRLGEIAASARAEALTLIPFGAQAPETLRSSRPLDEAALQRGVRLRTLYLHSVVNDPVTLKYIRWLVAAGAEVRSSPALPTRLLIVDRQVAFIAVDAEDSSRGAVVVRSRGILSLALALFELLWRDARPVADQRARQRVDLDGTEREILRLLAKGHTDEAMAHRMGVSPRTIRRLVSGLDERLGARSRFQLGYLVGQSIDTSASSAPFAALNDD